MRNHVIPDELCLPEYDIEWTEADTKAAEQARRRSEAWALSPAGTPYGATEPEAPIDERAIDELRRKWKGAA